MAGSLDRPKRSRSAPPHSRVVQQAAYITAGATQAAKASVSTDNIDPAQKMMDQRGVVLHNSNIKARIQQADMQKRSKEFGKAAESLQSCVPTRRAANPLDAPVLNQTKRNTPKPLGVAMYGVSSLQSLDVQVEPINRLHMASSEISDFLELDTKLSFAERKKKC